MVMWKRWRQWEFVLTGWVCHKGEVWMLRKWPRSQLGLHTPPGTWTSSWICSRWSSWPRSGCGQWGRGSGPPAASRWRRPSRGSVRYLRWWHTAPGQGMRVTGVEIIRVERAHWTSTTLCHWENSGSCEGIISRRLVIVMSGSVKEATDPSNLPWTQGHFIKVSSAALPHELSIPWAG